MLGTSDTGIVYLCRHGELGGHLVALKVLFSACVADKSVHDRFRARTFALYGVNHPNVLRGYEYLRERDLIAFSMEYAAGGSLADRLLEELPIEEIVRVLREIASGLKALHAQEIVCLNLTPDNVLFAKDGTVKLSPYGNSLPKKSDLPAQSGWVATSVHYCPPEYLSSAQFDSRADIYGLGLLGFEMLTGDTPYGDRSGLDAIKKILNEAPVSPRTLRAECPESLASIITACLQPNPDLRPQSIDELLARIDTVQA